MEASNEGEDSSDRRIPRLDNDSEVPYSQQRSIGPVKRPVKTPRLRNDSELPISQEGSFGRIQRRIESEEQITLRLQGQRERYR